MSYLISMVRYRFDDLLFVLGSECFHCDPKFHRRVAVDGYELVVLKFDYVSAHLGNNTRNSVQLTRLVGKKDGDREDPVSQDQSLLHDTGHRDHVHVAAAQDRNYFFTLAVDVFERRHGQKTGVLDDHLVVLHHIEE